MSLTEVLTFAVEKVAKLGMDALKQSANAEQEMMSLATFVGAQNAPSVYHQLQDANTPFSTKTLAGVDKSLMSGGVSSDQALNDTINLANAITAVGGNDKALSDIALNMQRIKIEGKASREELQEFAKEGINVYQLLADATGKPIEKIKDLKVNYELLSAAFSKAGQGGGMYEGAIQAQSQTIGGKWSMFMNYIQLGEQNLTLSQADNIKEFEDILIAGAKKIPEIVEEIGPFVTRLFGEVRDLMPYIHQVVSSAFNILKPIGEFITSKDIVDLSKSIFKVSSDLINSFKPTIEMSVEALKPLAHLLTRFGGVIDGLLNPKGATIAYYNSQYGNVVGIGKKSFSEKNKAFAEITAGKTFKDYNEFKDYVVGTAMKNNLRQLPGAMFPGWNMTPSPYIHPIAGNKDISDFGNAPTYKPGAGSNAVADKADKISSGGVRAVTINLGKFFDNFTINTQTINEGIDHLDNAVAESLLRIMNSAAKARE